MPKRGSLFLLLAVLLLGACASTQPPPDYSGLFIPKSDQARVFFYAAYNTPADKPYFDESFRFHVSGYEGDVGTDKFIENAMAPGDYTLHVDQIDWGGNTAHTAKLKASLRAGRLYFFEAQAGSDKLKLAQIDPAQGEQDVKSRRRECLCTPPLSQRIEKYLGSMGL
jgi:hypothetical protein